MSTTSTGIYLECSTAPVIELQSEAIVKVVSSSSCVDIDSTVGEQAANSESRIVAAASLDAA